MKSRNWIIFALLISFVLYIIFSLIVLNFKSIYMNQEYPMWLDVKNKINNSSKIDFDIIYLGDSRAKAGLIVNEFEDKTNYKVLNLSIGGSTPIEGYYSLKNVLLQNSKIDKIILSYAPFHLAKVDSYWNRTVKFNFLTESEYEEIYQNALMIKEKSFLIKDYKDYKIKTGLYLMDFSNGIVQKRWKNNYEVSKYLETSNGHYYFGRARGTSGLNHEASTSNFKVLPLIDFYLKEIINLCKENNIKIFWFTMPFNKSSYENITQEYKINYNEYIDSFASKYFIVLNQLYYIEDINFGDPSHLYLGSYHVTNELTELLENR